MIVFTDSFEFVHTGSGQNIRFDVHWHDTLASVQELFYSAAAQDSDPDWNHFPREDCDALAESTLCWGFAYHARRRIHLWASDSAEITKVIATIAHEIGHTLPPFHRSREKEERKACKCEGAAFGAIYALMQYRSEMNKRDPLENGQAG